MEEASDPESTQKCRIYQDLIEYWNRGQDNVTDDGNKLDITRKPLNTFQ